MYIYIYNRGKSSLIKVRKEIFEKGAKDQSISFYF